MSEQEKPGRYQRSVGGLLGAMIITAAIVLGLGALRLLVFGGNPEVEREAIDFDPVIVEIQRADPTTVYPAELPDGWIVTDVDFEPGAPGYGIDLLTDDERFVGLRDSTLDGDEVVEEFIDDAADEEEEPFVPPGDTLAEEWQVWVDDGGDTGYLAEIGTRRVLVYGTAPRDELQDFLASLTTDPLE